MKLDLFDKVNKKCSKYTPGRCCTMQGPGEKKQKEKETQHDTWNKKRTVEPQKLKKRLLPIKWPCSILFIQLVFCHNAALLRNRTFACGSQKYACLYMKNLWRRWFYTRRSAHRSHRSEIELFQQSILLLILLCLYWRSGFRCSSWQSKAVVTLVPFQEMLGSLASLSIQAEWQVANEQLFPPASLTHCLTGRISPRAATCWGALGAILCLYLLYCCSSQLGRQNSQD